MLVEDAMNTKIIIARKEDSLHNAIRAMTENRTGSVLVVDHKLVGIVTERDVLRAILKWGDLRKVKVKDVMTPNPITINHDSTLEDAAVVMNSNKIKKLPVLKENRLVGIVTASDLISAKPAIVETIGKLLLSKPKRAVGIAG